MDKLWLRSYIRWNREVGLGRRSFEDVLEDVMIGIRSLDKELSVILGIKRWLELF